MKRTLLFILYSLIGILFLYFAFRKVELGRFVRSLKSVKVQYLIPASFFYLLNFFIRSLRWRYLFGPDKKVMINSLFSSMMIGYLINNIMPARLGEFARFYILGEKENISKSLILGTIVVERTFDGLTLLLLFVLLSFFFPATNWINKFAFIAAIFFILIMVCLFLLSYQRQKMLKFMGFLFSFFPEKIKERINKIIDRFIEGLQILHYKTLFFIVFLFSLLIWIIQGYGVYFFSVASGLKISIFASTFLVLVCNLAIMIPSLPGYVGTVQFFSVVILVSMGIEKSAALGFSITMHIIQYLLVTILGLIYYWKMHISLFKLVKKGEESFSG